MDTRNRLRLAAVAAYLWVRHWLQFASIRLALLAGVVSGLQASYPDQFAQLMGLLPEAVRPLVGVMVALAAIYSRTKPQPGINRGRGGPPQ